jgi:GT2 family glycosyltransferase
MTDKQNSGVDLRDVPFVSVVVPSYNAIQTIEECLSSIQDQTYPAGSYEVIAVDNNSSDGTPDLIRAAFPAVLVMFCEKPGSGYARNVGFQAAAGSLILSTDADCVADRSWIELLVASVSSAAPQVAAIGGRIEPYACTTLAERYRPMWPCQRHLRSDAPNLRYVEAGNCAFRAESIRAVGWFDGAVGHDDADLGIRLGKAGFQMEYAPAAVVRHRNPRTFREIYAQKYKYGIRNFRLFIKYPDVFEDPRNPNQQLALSYHTARRIIIDLLVKLPIAVVLGGGDLPRIWPVMDAIAAFGGYMGARQAFHDFKRRSGA